MGCASSTPMVATAGSDMLKAATHVASDAAKGAENAVGEVADTVGRTLESAKETVGTAVTGIAHDLSNVFTEKSSELDTAKNELLEHLHLGGADAETLEQTSETSTNHLDTKALEAAARAPTPPPDLDSLKTSTPEPEIEKAMANSPEDTPPTPQPTIAELEKLAAEVKQTAQTNVATALAAESSATAATESYAEVKHALTAAPIGTTAATEPAVDLVALLAAEKRPGTTEWEKHADRLSKTQKRNAFKGGGKFRRFRPAVPQIQSIHPANYIESIEPSEPVGNTMKHALLEDDSCFSDVYYNSRSSSPYSTSSNSPKIRRARLPTRSVLAMNAKHRQRELAVLLSDRRSAVRSLTVSPTFGRQFDYNPQRVRYASPTPSMVEYTRSAFSPPVVMQTELPPLARPANWKRNREISGLSSIPDYLGRPARANTHLSSPPVNNVITQSTIKSTKAFAPLRAKATTGRSRIFGHTRTGSPVNRRVFARRADLPLAKKSRVFTTQPTGSPVRTRALIQERIETAKKVEKQVAQPPTIIKLEREASIKESTTPSIAEMVANGFSLSRALSPIKMAAESHSLTHLKSVEHKSTAATTHSLLEVVEQAVERTKNGGISTKSDGRSEEVIQNKGKETDSDIRGKSQKEKKPSETNKKDERKDQTQYNKPTGKENSKETNLSGDLIAETGKEIHTTNSNASSSRSKKQLPSSKRQSIAEKDASNYSNRNNSSNSFADAERYTASSNKNETVKKVSDENKHNNWRHSISGNKEQSTGKSENKSGRINNPKSFEKVNSPRTYSDYKSENFEIISSRNSYVKEDSSPARREQTNHNNNWKSFERRNSEVKYTNISNRFEPHVDKGIIASPNTHKYPRSIQIEEDDNLATSSAADESDFSQASEYDLNANRDVFYSTESTEEYEITSPTRSYQEYRKSGNNKNKRLNSNSSNPSPTRVYDKHKSKSPGHNLTQTPNNLAYNQKYKLLAKDNQIKDHLINYQRISKSNIPSSKNADTSTKITVHPNSQVPNSLNSSPSQSSKSSTSIVIRTIPSTPETEEYHEVALPNRLHEEMEQRYETIEEASLSTSETDDRNEVPSPKQLHEDIESHHEIFEDVSFSTSETENYNDVVLPNEKYEYSYETNEESNHSMDENIKMKESTEEESTEPTTVVSSSTDFDETIHNDMSLLSPHTSVHNNCIYAASSIKDLLNMLPPETAYLKLGRSATMLTLRSSSPIIDAHSLSYRSTPQGRYKRHSACDNYHVEKVPFVAELSSVARSRSPLVSLSPYKIRTRCAVCYNKYVIK